MLKVTELGNRNGRYQTLGSLRNPLLGGYCNAINSVGSVLRINTVEEINNEELNRGRCCTAMQSQHFSAIFNRALWSCNRFSEMS